MLPEISLKAEISSLESTPSELQEQPPKLHILLVDDEEELRTILSFALLQAGYKVTTAIDGRTALQLLKEQQPNIVLLDLMLPDMDGMEVCWRIREFSDVPILIITAVDRDADKVWGLKAGADDYLTKPFSVRELVARVEAILRRYMLVQQIVGEKQSTHP